LSFDLPYLIGVIRRGWALPVIGALIGLIAGLVYAGITPSLYTSSARILLDRTVNSFLQSKKIIDVPVLEDNAAASQLHIISSESIILPVVRSMNLAHDPEFVGPSRNSADSHGWDWASLIGRIKRLIKSEAPAPSEQMLERIAVESFLKRLTVNREDVPSVITITFGSEDPGKAAAIANAIAERYLTANDEAKMKSTRLAGELLQERLNELKQQAAAADKLLINFTVSNNLSAHRKVADSGDAVSSLTSQLMNAQAAIAELKARLNVMNQGESEDIAVERVTDNAVILQLRAQYLDNSVRVAELESRVGSTHTAVLKLRGRADELKRAILNERQRVANSYKNEYEIAKARKEEIASELAKLVSGEGGGDSQARVTMRELESSADTLRRSYDNVLQRLNELSTASDVIGPDARIITKAAPSIRKASRKAQVVLGGGVLAGIMLGLGLAFARELVSGVIRVPGHLKDVTDAYCVVLPRVRVVAAKKAKSGGIAPRMEEYVLDAPFSRFTESFRNVIAVLLAGREPNRGNIVCVVSSVPKEGKTTITTNLGALLATNTDWRVLVIDCDLHRASLTHKLTPEAKEGLIEALEAPSRLSSLAVKMERSGLHVLPCVTINRPSNAAELLGSRKMEMLLEQARDMYDFIIIEAPPIMSVADVKMLEHQMDQFVLITEWGVTTRRLAQETLDEVEGVRARLACVVLNKADPAFLKNIETYKGARFGEYYEG
jgi:succinoglycan biosynthesis transport protein ExoP